MEELLKIAKELYPIGTVYITCGTDIEATITTGLFRVRGDQIVEVDEKGVMPVKNGFAAEVYDTNYWAKIISKPEVKEESMTLLEEAKKRFPVGTTFKSAYNPTRKGKVTHLNFFEENGKIFTEEIYYDAEEGIGEAIYYNGVWAEIIDIPKVGDSFKWEEMEVGGNGEMFKEQCDISKPKDPVNPSHYISNGMECIDAIRHALSPEEFRGFLRGNIIKYNWRCMQKNGVEDLKKAQWYLDRLIKTLENVESKSN